MMKRLSLILLMCVMVSVASAQEITHTFQNVPLSDALKYVQTQATDYNITFIYDELEDFRVTTHIQNKSITGGQERYVNLLLALSYNY